MQDYTTLPLFARKTCTNCGESKPLSEYHKLLDNLRPTCKVCTNAQNRSIYRRNHEQHLELKRRYRAENPEARRATVKQHAKRHPKEMAAYQAVWRAIRDGKMSKPSIHLCTRCHAPAEVYHHHSYEKQYQLDVIPLCRVCHGKEHRKV